jgi:hypothetical protein
MDNAKRTDDLVTKLTSYNVMVLCLFVLLILSGILYLANKNGFNQTFGTELFALVPLLLLVIFIIKEAITIKEDPNNAWFNHFSWFKNWYTGLGNTNKFDMGVGILLAVLIIGIFFTILGIGGIFSQNPPENNVAVIINCIVLFFFTVAAFSIYFKSSLKDTKILPKLNINVRTIYEERTKFTLWFLAYVIFITFLYFLNPGGIMTTIGGPTIFFSLFVGFIFAMMIIVYQYTLMNGSQADILSGTPTFMSLFIKGLYIIGSLVISGLLIYEALNLMGFFNQNANTPETWGHFIINLLIFCGMLGIIYRLISAGGFLEKNPYYRLIINTLFYIPCLLVYLVYTIAQILGLTNTPGTLPPSKNEIKFLLITLLLVLGYFFWFYFMQPYLKSNYLIQGGDQYINQPISTDVLTNVASYETLNGGNDKTYQYAMSFWFYLDAFPPNTSGSYAKVVPILSYGQNPSIKYSSVDNTLYITVNQHEHYDDLTDEEIAKRKTAIADSEQWKKWKEFQKSIPADEHTKLFWLKSDIATRVTTDDEGHRIIYKQPNVLLQKWNHIVLNYNGGTLDIFYNGKLVKSAIEVVPYMSLDMLSVGTDKGINGNVANLIYFKAPIDLLTVSTLYNSLKGKNPPTNPENNKRLIPLPNNLTI